jgi:RNA polymerase sigma factor (sigma-70 family)
MERERLAEQFEGNRPRLRSVAYRMLGSASEAEDAVQEAWLRLNRAEAAEIENLGGWLTTVVSRVCLDQLRARKSRREEPLPPEPQFVGAADPEREALLSESVGMALLVVLDRLAPAERVAFVLHDLFAIPFEEVAAILDRSPVAVRQLASRARRRVQGASEPTATPITPGHQQLVDAFLSAARNGDFQALLGVLAPDAVLRADRAAVAMGVAPELRGAEAVAGLFNGGRGVRAALLDGVPGLVWAPGGVPRVVFRLTFGDGRIAAIEQIGDAEVIAGMSVQVIRRGA